MKTAFLFSGQGAQHIGMGQDLIHHYPICRDVFNCAGDILGFDLEKICKDGDEKTLMKTDIAQPATMAVSLASFFLLKNSGILPNAVAGHSLGEYAAMVASEMLSLEDGFKIIKIRAQLMQEAAEKQNGMMCAILGPDAKEVEKVCAHISGGWVKPVNYNSPKQTVIAGDAPAVTAAMEELKEKARRIIPLKTAAAFHTPFMQSAADALKEELQKFSFHSPKYCFYSNITGTEISDFSNMPELLANHMVSPVLFVQELNQMYQQQIHTFIELGPGKVLQGLVKKTLPADTAAYTVNDKASFEKVLSMQ